MKVYFISLLTLMWVNGYSQQNPQTNKAVQKKTSSTNPGTYASPTAADMAPRKTVTEKYLNGVGGSDTTRKNLGQSSGSKSPFAGGIYAANNTTPFDSVTINNPNSINNRNSTNAVIQGGNDTTFNVNSIGVSGATTNSGAVDRSGQSQFGQSNWGNSRSTVGESQWTVPPPITASFNKEFPQINNATWVRNNVDTSLYSARYQSGASWVTTNYNNAGQRLDTKTEIPLLQPPRPVSVYLAKQPANFQAVNIYFLQMQGRPDLYVITTRSGKTIYINNDGMEVNQ